MRFLVLATTALLSTAVTAKPFVNAQIGVGSDKANKVSIGYSVDKHSISLGYMASEGKSDKTYLDNSGNATERHETEAEFATIDYSYILGSFDGFDMFLNAAIGVGNSDNTFIETEFSPSTETKTDSKHTATYYGLHFGLSRTFESVDNLSLYGLVGIDSYDYETFDSGGLSGNIGLRYTF
ncbi:hypothetical protein L4D20_09280 [Vibrio kyushuensis]|uniref:hypothetical protein n=1 Tax=Vibrio TaxID=662 RepID=UPI003D0E6577